MTADFKEVSEFVYSQLETDLRLYQTVKFTNWAATIQTFPLLWQAFLQIDSILREEFSASENITDTRHLIPRLLFTHVHSQFRISMELAFCTCVHEAGAIMRGAVESGVIGYKLYQEPQLVKVWQEGDGTPESKAAFKKHFRENRKKNLFSGLPELERLHKFWIESSELTTHSNMGDIARRTSMGPAPGVKTEVHYFERDTKYAAMYILQLLHVARQLEGLMFRIFEGRLQLHPSLSQLRQRFDQTADSFKAKIVREWNIQPDGSMGP